jgi:hypothetical protein
MASTAFAELKRNRKQLFTQQQEAAKKTANDKGYEKDSRFWTPTFDKAGRAQALIRFLPPVEGEPSGFVRLYQHYFKGPAGWYKEHCLSTLGLKDPVQELARRLWEIKTEPAHDKARQIGRRKRFISNIWVKRDPLNPDAEGKVFLYDYPGSIYDMVNTAMNGGSEDSALGDDAQADTFEVFSFWGSRDFKIDIYKKGNFPQYEKCGFVGKDSDLLNGDEEALEEVWKQQHSLAQFLDQKNFKTADELKTNFLSAVGCNSMEDAFQFLIGGAPDSSGGSSVDDVVKEEMRATQRPAASKPATQRPTASKPVDDDPPADTGGTDDDTDSSYLDELMAATPKGRNGKKK